MPPARSAGPADTRRHTVAGSEFGARAQPGASAAQLGSGAHVSPAHHPGTVTRSLAVGERKS